MNKLVGIIFKLILIADIAVLFSVNAAAYLDASVMTYTIQIVVGIVIALGASAGILITKLKKKAKDKFNIDLDANKTVEDKVVRTTVNDATISKEYKDE